MFFQEISSTLYLRKSWVDTSLKYQPGANGPKQVVISKVTPIDNCLYICNTYTVYICIYTSGYTRGMTKARPRLRSVHNVSPLYISVKLTVATPFFIFIPIPTPTPLYIYTCTSSSVSAGGRAAHVDPGRIFSRGKRIDCGIFAQTQFRC